MVVVPDLTVTLPVVVFVAPASVFGAVPPPAPVDELSEGSSVVGAAEVEGTTAATAQLAPGLEDEYAAMAHEIHTRFYSQVRRYASGAFKRMKASEVATMVKDEVEPLGGTGSGRARAGRRLLRRRRGGCRA